VISSSSSSFEQIRISDPEVVDGNKKVVVHLDISDGLRKYFFTTKLGVEYDIDVTGCDSSILVLPALSVVAPIAWSRGSDVIVEKADEAYLDSLQNVRRILKGWFPQFSFKGEIRVEQAVKNEFHDHKKDSLLFSGGVDSLTSYVRTKGENPITLITLLMGEDRYLPFYEKLKNAFQKFARDQGNDIHFIKSDIWNGTNNVVNNMELASDISLPAWWRDVSLGVVTLGLCAPLTVAAEIGTVRYSSAFTDKQGTPDGSFYLSKTGVAWGNIRMVYGGNDVTRQQKIRHFLKGNNHLYQYLLVCNNNFEDYAVSANNNLYPENCSYCEKCLRTITGLILEGIDPNECNFNVDNKVLQFVQSAFTSGSLNLQENGLFWRDIQEHIANSSTDFNDTISQKYSAKEFFEWFRNFDIDSYKPSSYNLLKTELRFSMKHKGTHFALTRTTKYILRRARKVMHKTGRASQQTRGLLPSN
jgi:hypothetical protein